MSVLTKDDKKARTLCGLPIPVGGVDVHPLKVREVILTGEFLYHYYLTLVTMVKKVMEIQSNLTVEELAEIDEFALLFYLETKQYSFIQDIKYAMEFFLSPDRKIEFDIENFKILIYQDSLEEKKLVGSFVKETYDEFIDVLKHQNHVQQDEEDEKPADEATKELLEQRKKAREAVAKAKGEKGDKLSLADYISIINAKSLNVNTNFLEATIYSFYDYLERLMLIDNYEVTLKQILAGVDPKKVKLKHWATKL